MTTEQLLDLLTQTFYQCCGGLPKEETWERLEAAVVEFGESRHDAGYEAAQEEVPEWLRPIGA